MSPLDDFTPIESFMYTMAIADPDFLEKSKKIADSTKIPRKQALIDAIETVQTKALSPPNLEPITYIRYLKNVENSYKFIKAKDFCSDIPANNVADKLNELATSYIVLEKQNLKGFSRFMDIIKQVFKGHGFRTTGEWGLELATMIKKHHPLNLPLKNEINALLSSQATPSSTIYKQVNELPDLQFTDLLNETIFLKTNLKSGVSDFYKKLEESKKTLFNKVLDKKPNSKDLHRQMEQDETGMPRLNISKLW